MSSSRDDDDFDQTLPPNPLGPVVSSDESNQDETLPTSAPIAETGNFSMPDSSMPDSSKSDPGATGNWPEGAIDPSQTFAYVPSDAAQQSFKIPGYELIGELGRGAMGVVYKARQIRADRIVALKVMINIDHARPADIERFTVEAQSSARLHHPNIIQVYEVGQSGQSPYFTQEFATGGTLSSKIAKQMLSHAETAQVMHSLAAAVAYAHSRQIVHRDLKPLNILIDENGNPKIADFGLARRMEDQSHLTQDGTILGTPSYMAPEQASGNSNAIGPLSDVYSLGAILYELLTGRPPFKGATVWEVIQQVRSAEPVPPSQLQAGVPADLETICLKCLQKSPDKRYESAQLLADDIQRHIRNEPILARPIGQWERILRLCKRNPREARLVGLVAGLLTCFAIVASWTAYRVNQDRLQIRKQRDEIGKQRDEITKEKGISDERLTLYRTTVGKLVNRAPRLLQGAPIGSGIRNELTNLLNGILAESEDSSDSSIVGSAKKWGRTAVAMREGEILMGQVNSLQQNHGEILEKALERFSEAERIATEVYESPEPDRAKAASNLAFAKVRNAQTRFAADPSKWKECIPLHRRAIELNREALSSPILPGGNPKPLKESELGNELIRYAEFLLSVGKTDNQFAKKNIEKLTEYLREAESLQLSALSAVDETPEIEEDARNRLALTYRYLAQAALIRGDLPAVNQNYELSVSNYLALLEKSGYRFGFRQNLVGCSNEYGDYLLGIHADPGKIEQQYRLAMDSLNNMMQTPEMISLEQDGLAMGHYRLGLACLRGGKDREAESHFRHSAVLREKAYRDASESLGSESTTDAVLPQRIAWLLVQARSGMATDVTKTVEELVKRAMSNAPIQSAVSKMDIFLQCSAALGILSQTMSVRENPASSETLQSQAIKSLTKAIDVGYRDVNYLKSDADFEWLSQSDALKSIEDKIQELIASDPPAK
jgi:tRNA A-37 threonylcarbamoyl transferase component Bud32